MDKGIKNKKGKDGKQRRIFNEKLETRDLDKVIKRDNQRKGRRDLMAESAILEREVIGIRDLRQNLAGILDKVTNRYDVVTAEDKIKAGRKASIIATDVLKELMNCYEMTSEIDWDEQTQQYYVIVNEIEIDGVGDTQDEAIEIAMDNAEMAAENYFELIEMYMRVTKYKKMYPYFLKIKMASVFNMSLKEILGFK